VGVSRCVTAERGRFKVNIVPAEKKSPYQPT
jgi:hypothetical protein